MGKLGVQEYAAFYASYVDRFKNQDILSCLSIQSLAYNNLLLTKKEKDKDYKYEQDKWSIAELLLHISDTERVFSYRALSIARGDQVALPGFDQDEYVVNSNAHQRSLKSLIAEFGFIRQSTISLFKSFDKESLRILGNANGQSVSVRGLGYIILGHCQHHMEILSERYFV